MFKFNITAGICAAIAVVLCSCETRQTNKITLTEWDLKRADSVQQQKDASTHISGILVYDGCQYLRQSTSNGYHILIHKGNCNSRFHKK